MITSIKKRNGDSKPYDRSKIEEAIYKAFVSCGKMDRSSAIKIAQRVEDSLVENFLGREPTIEEVQDVVEMQLIHAEEVQVAKAYILYRDMKNRARETGAVQNDDYFALNAQVVIRKNGFFQLDKDKEALQAYMRDVEAKTLSFANINDRVRYLIDNGFYEDFYQKYKPKQIQKAYDLLLSYHFEFQSFMSASKFYRDYALKTNDKKTYLERYEDRILSTALHLADGNEALLMDYCKAMITQYYQPATPTFLDSGKNRRGQLVSCFLLEVDDSLNSISFNLSTAMYLSKIGGGVALNLSRLRARGESVKGVHNSCKGVVPVLKLLEDGFNYADKMGQRKGAGVAYLNIFHADIEDFLDTKKINADEKSRIQSLSLGLTVPDKFFELAKNNQDYYVFYPHTVYTVFGKHLDEMDMETMYDQLVAHPDVRKKKLNPRDMLNTIAKVQFESGYPYIIYIDSANKQNPLKGVGKIKMSNLCTEIFQNQIGSTINDYDQPDEIGSDVCCVLGSLNIVNVMQGKEFEFAVSTGMRALTSVVDSIEIKNAPTIDIANKQNRAVGLGAMNLHGYFALNQMRYDSEDAKDFANTFFMMVNYYSIKASMQIAKERKSKFKNFEGSEYAKGVYFDKYTQGDFSPKSDKVKGLFEGIAIPGKKEWEALKKEVKKHGLYHAYRLAIAP
ncbi:MAG: class 1b ribonucleoside-diphosphate reductase subunit alpha, partial [Firmicutes bacterium]|nr:class 1b ribonucleoside-diphosphate reductase subunit alpha [Bacillota bacterium]